MKTKARMIWARMTPKGRKKALVYYCNPIYQVHHKCEHGGSDFTPQRKPIRP